jgi:hypothetical protein
MTRFEDTHQPEDALEENPPPQRLLTPFRFRLAVSVAAVAVGSFLLMSLVSTPDAGGGEPVAATAPSPEQSAAERASAVAQPDEQGSPTAAAPAVNLTWQSDFATFGKTYRETMVRDAERGEKLFADQSVRWPMVYKGLREVTGEKTLEFEHVEGPLGSRSGPFGPYAVFYPARPDLSRWEDMPRGTRVVIAGRIDLTSRSWVTDAATGERLPGAVRVVDVAPCPATLPAPVTELAATPPMPPAPLAQAPTPAARQAPPPEPPKADPAPPPLSPEERRLIRSRSLISSLCRQRDAWSLGESPLQETRTGQFTLRTSASLSGSQQRELAAIRASKTPWVNKVERLAVAAPVLYPIFCSYGAQPDFNEVVSQFGPPESREEGLLHGDVSGTWYGYGSVRVGVWRGGRVLVVEVNGSAWLEEQEAARSGKEADAPPATPPAPRRSRPSRLPPDGHRRRLAQEPDANLARLLPAH